MITKTFDPEKWQLVPKGATQEMISRVIDERMNALIEGTEHNFIAIYKAMLAAAPEAPDAEPVNEQLLDALKHILETVPAQQDGGGFIVDHHSPDGDYIGSQNIDPMWVVQEMASIAFAAIAAAEQQQAEPHTECKNCVRFDLDCDGAEYYAPDAAELTDVEFLKVYTSTTGKQLPTTGTSRKEFFAVFRAVIAADRAKRGAK